MPALAGPVATPSPATVAAPPELPLAVTPEWIGAGAGPSTWLEDCTATKIQSSNKVTLAGSKIHLDPQEKVRIGRLSAADWSGGIALRTGEGVGVAVPDGDEVDEAEMDGA